MGNNLINILDYLLQTKRSIPEEKIIVAGRVAYSEPRIAHAWHMSNAVRTQPDHQSPVVS